MDIRNYSPEECKSKGTYNSEQEKNSCPENQDVPNMELSQFAKPAFSNDGNWSYIYLHNSRIRSFRNFMDKNSPFPTFVLQIKCKERMGYSHTERREHFKASGQLAAGGIVFIQGCPKDIQFFFTSKSLPFRLVYDCATHKPAEIPDQVMRPFRQLVEIGSKRIGILPKPFSHYAAGHVRLRIVSGQLKGLEGYVLRVNRDRKLIMQIGQLTLAISGIHREEFEEVLPAGISAKFTSREQSCIQENVAKSLFVPQTQEEVLLCADNARQIMRQALCFHERGNNEIATNILIALFHEVTRISITLSYMHTLDTSPISNVEKAIKDWIALLS